MFVIAQILEQTRHLKKKIPLKYFSPSEDIGFLKNQKAKLTSRSSRAFRLFSDSVTTWETRLNTPKIQTENKSSNWIIFICSAILGLVNESLKECPKHWPSLCKVTLDTTKIIWIHLQTKYWNWKGLVQVGGKTESYSPFDTNPMILGGFQRCILYAGASIAILFFFLPFDSSMAGSFASS